PTRPVLRSAWARRALRAFAHPTIAAEARTRAHAVSGRLTSLAVRPIACKRVAMAAGASGYIGRSLVDLLPRAARSTACPNGDVGMIEGTVTRRGFAMTLSVAGAAAALPTLLTRQAQAADTFREGLQIGAMGALRTTLPGADKKYDLTFDAKDFRD